MQWDYAFASCLKKVHVELILNNLQIKVLNRSMIIRSNEINDVLYVSLITSFNDVQPDIMMYSTINVTFIMRMKINYTCANI